MPDKAKAPAGNDSIRRSLHRDGSFAPRPRAALNGAGIFANGASAMRLQVWRGLLDITASQCQGYEQTRALPFLHLSDRGNESVRSTGQGIVD